MAAQEARLDCMIANAKIMFPPLTRTAQLLERDGVPREKNPATQLYEILLDSDSIEFVVGARINEAHQDPNLPIDLEIRRNIVKRIRTVLEEKYLKETRMRVF